MTTYDQIDDAAFMDHLGDIHGYVQYGEWASPVEDEFFERERQRALYELNVELTRPCDPLSVQAAKRDYILREKTSSITSYIMAVLSDGENHHLLNELQAPRPDLSKESIWNATTHLMRQQRIVRVKKGTYRLRRI